MKRNIILVYFVCLYLIDFLGVTARQDDDIELLEELIETLTENIGKNDVRDILEKKAIASHSNRNVRNKYFHRYNNYDIRGMEDEHVLEALVNDNEEDEEEALMREIQTYLKAKRFATRSLCAVGRRETCPKTIKAQSDPCWMSNSSLCMDYFTSAGGRLVKAPGQVKTAKKWIVEDPNVRGTDGTTSPSPTPPETNPPTTTTTTTTTAPTTNRFPFRLCRSSGWWWSRRWRYCRR